MGLLLYALDKVREQANEFYNPIRDEKRPLQILARLCWENLFGIEINDQIARTAKMNMIIHDDGHTNVIASDGLLSDVEMQAKSKKEFEYGTLILSSPIRHLEAALSKPKSIICTNTIWRLKIDWLNTSPSSKASALSDSQSTEVLFLSNVINFNRTRLFGNRYSRRYFNQ